MNTNQLINMVVRMVLRPLINKGIKAGIDRASRGRAPADQTPEQKALHDQQSNETSKRARQAAKLGRRMGRF
ncbi:MAG: hypothetical protein ACRBBK_00315 [Paracoccaceae bacterium]